MRCSSLQTDRYALLRRLSIDWNEGYLNPNLNSNHVKNIIRSLQFFVNSSVIYSKHHAKTCPKKVFKKTDL